MSHLFLVTFFGCAFLLQSVQSWSSSPPALRVFQSGTTNHPTCRVPPKRDVFRLLARSDDDDDLFDDEDEDEDENEEDNVEEDWRAFRAKLVMQEKGQDISESSSSNDDETTTKANKRKWAYDAGQIIEKGSLIVSNPVQDFACGGLRQQYFHKCVVLVVQHDPKVFTKGIIMNRPTKEIRKDSRKVDWNVWFSGDVQGLESDDEEYTCLHRLTTPMAKKLSLTVVDDIQQTDWDIAQYLVEQGEATPDDFWLGSGYAGWAPGQLQGELERGSWLMVASDSESIFELLEKAPADKSGTLVWSELMKSIGKQNVLEEVDQSFEDNMLEEWIKSLRPLASSSSAPKPKNGNMLRNPEPGQLLRASSTILLDDQALHQSLVLILDSNEQGTAGLLLNRPSSATVSVAGGKMPLRYGGPYGMSGMKPEFWVYYDNKKLRDASVGVQIGDSLFGRCLREDAATAMTMGLAKPTDFLVIAGISFWPRSKDLGGKPLAKVELERYFSNVDSSVISNVWGILKTQETLNKDNVADNLQSSRDVWKVASGSKVLMESDDDEARSLELANDALDRWTRLFLVNLQMEW